MQAPEVLQGVWREHGGAEMKWGTRWERAEAQGWMLPGGRTSSGQAGAGAGAEWELISAEGLT